MRQGIAVVALGGAGANHLNALPEDRALIASKALVDKRSSLPAIECLDLETIGTTMLALDNVPGVPLSGQTNALLEGIKPGLRENLQDAELIVVCAGLGGEVGTLLTEAFVAWATQAYRSTPLICNLALPFATEGRQRAEIAEQAAISIRKKSLSTLCVRMDAFVSRFSGMPLLDLFRCIDAAWIGHSTDWHRLLKGRIRT
jgi:cell division GTPase FtsZ